MSPHLQDVRAVYNRDSEPIQSVFALDIGGQNFVENNPLVPPPRPQKNVHRMPLPGPFDFPSYTYITVNNSSCAITVSVTFSFAFLRLGLKNKNYYSCFYSCRYQQLIKENLSEVAKLITVEQGKTIPDAEGDVMRGLQVRI